jgi:hypothetical protein
MMNPLVLSKGRATVDGNWVCSGTVPSDGDPFNGFWRHIANPPKGPVLVTSANPTTVDDNCPPVSMSNVALGFIVALTDAIVLDCDVPCCVVVFHGQPSRKPIRTGSSRGLATPIPEGAWNLKSPPECCRTHQLCRRHRVRFWPGFSRTLGRLDPFGRLGRERRVQSGPGCPVNSSVSDLFHIDCKVRVWHTFRRKGAS